MYGGFGVKTLSFVDVIRNFFRRAPLARQPVKSVVRSYKHPDDLPEDVQQLFQAAENESIEFGLTWYRNLIHTVYLNHEGVRTYVLFLDGIPAAAIPLVITKTTFGKRIESLSNYYTALYAPAIIKGIEAGDLVPLLTAIRRANPYFGCLRLSPMDPQSNSYRLLLDGLRTARMLPFEFYCFGNWFLRVDGGWPNFLTSRSATLRSNIKRAVKKFQADGGTLELVCGGAELERGINAYESVYTDSWKVAEPFAEFVPGLMNACARRGWLRLGVAWLNGEPIAAQLWFVAGCKAYIYKVAYRENFKAYSPGTLLTAMLMQHVIDRDQVTEVDYQIGDDPYKRSWMSDRRERWGIVAYNLRSVEGLVGFARESIGRALKPLRASASTHTAQLRARYHHLRARILAPKAQINLGHDTSDIKSGQ